MPEVPPLLCCFLLHAANKAPVRINLAALASLHIRWWLRCSTACHVVLDIPCCRGAGRFGGAVAANKILHHLSNKSDMPSAVVPGGSCTMHQRARL